MAMICSIFLKNVPNKTKILSKDSASYSNQEHYTEWR